MCSWPVQGPGTPAFPRQQAGDTRGQPACASSTGSEVSPCGLLQDSVVQGYVSNQLLQSGVLLLEFLQASGLLHPHAAILTSSAIVGLLCYPYSPAGLAYRLPLAQMNLSLSQFVDDLLGRERLSAHTKPPFQINPGLTFYPDRFSGGGRSSMLSLATDVTSFTVCFSLPVRMTQWPSSILAPCYTTYWGST